MRECFWRLSGDYRECKRPVLFVVRKPSSASVREACSAHLAAACRDLTTVGRSVTVERVEPSSPSAGGPDGPR